MSKLSFKIANFSFSLSSIITIILGVGLLVSLGFWQLERAVQKTIISQTILAKQQQIINLNEAELNSLSSFTRISVTGEYDIQQQFIYDNNIYQGRAGVFILTPFKFNNTSILVNRGWQSLADRSQLKQLNLDFIPRGNTINGRLIKPVVRFTLADNTQEQQFPMVIQAIELEIITKQLAYPVLPLILQLSPQAGNGFIRDWQPFYGSTDKHIAYAIQWFCFAGIFLVIMFILHRNKLK